MTGGCLGTIRVAGTENVDYIPAMVSVLRILYTAAQECLLGVLLA